MEDIITGTYVSMFISPIFVGKTSKDISSLLIECKDQQRIDKEGRIKSNRGGWQSKKIDTQIINDYVLDQVNKVAIDWGIRTTLKIENCWFNVNRSGNYNQAHYHAGSILSGVLYLKCPKGSSPIVFENPIYPLMESYIEPYVKYNHTPPTSYFFSYNPEECGIIIFPSWIRHRVDSSNFDGERICISFNTSADYETQLS